MSYKYYYHMDKKIRLHIGLCVAILSLYIYILQRYFKQYQYSALFTLYILPVIFIFLNLMQIEYSNEIAYKE